MELAPGFTGGAGSHAAALLVGALRNLSSSKGSLHCQLTLCSRVSGRTSLHIPAGPQLSKTYAEVHHSPVCQLHMSIMYTGTAPSPNCACGRRRWRVVVVMGVRGTGGLWWGTVSCTLFLAVNGLYSASDDVIELTPTNFNKEVIQSESLWLVEFYAPWCGHCQRLTPEWKKAATALKGVVKVGAVDADKHQSLGGQYGVRGFPTIKIFGANKNKAEDYQGGRTSEAIVDAALSALRSLVKDRLSGRSGGYSSGRQSRESGGGDKKDVIELTDDSFDKNVINSDDVWMVEFYAPWCGHCKNLEPEWAAAATEVKEQTKGKVKLAAVDATVNQMLANRYGIRGFPTIKIFQKGEDPVDYDGGRTRSDITARALDLFSDNAPPPELLEIINEDVLKTTCDAHQLCIISVLPHILDTGASGRNSYLDVMLKMAEKYKKKMWGWLWTEAGAQSDLESSLGIGGFGYPAMAAINARKMKFALLKGSFSEQGINEFLRELSVGRGSTAPVGGGAFPKIHAVEPWDGKDGELPVEDDIDLSDVDLDDIWDKDEL